MLEARAASSASTSRASPAAAAPNALLYYGPQTNDDCGYCGAGPSLSWGMRVQTMACADYQRLIDRGWRRSGTYMYKPNLRQSCCPAYTIRLDTTRFRPSKGHKTLLRKVRRMAETGAVPGAAGGEGDGEGDDDDDGGKSKRKASKTDSAMVTPDMSSAALAPAASAASSASLATATRPAAQEKKKRPKKEGLAQLASARVLPINFRAMFAGCASADAAAKDVITVDLVPATFHNEDFELYKKYQIAVHGDAPSEVTVSGYTRFLVTSPLQRVTVGGVEYGSFHQHYRLNGRLIAVGVIDVLPKCISSVYTYYDPELRSLALGVFSVLQEIDLALRLHERVPELQYYYMGFYIHSCQKMRYKGQYHPSELLDLPTLTWVPLDVCTPVIEKDPRAVSLHADRPLTKGLGLPPYDPARGAENPNKDDLAAVRVREDRGAVTTLAAYARQPRLVLYFAECVRLIGREVQEKSIFELQ